MCDYHIANDFDVSVNQLRDDSPYFLTAVAPCRASHTGAGRDDLTGFDLHFGTNFANTAVNRGSRRLYAEPDNIAAAVRCARQHPVFISKQTPRLCAATIDTEEEGHP
jgi:hypothetical protein